MTARTSSSEPGPDTSPGSDDVARPGATPPGAAAEEGGFGGPEADESATGSDGQPTGRRRSAAGTGGPKSQDGQSAKNGPGVADRLRVAGHLAVSDAQSEAMIEEFRQEYTREAAKMVAPPGITSINAGGRVDTVSLGYQVEALFRRTPNTPGARAELLDKYLSPGKKGAEELAEMVSADHHILQQIRTPGGGESLVRHLFMRRLSAAIAEQNGVIGKNPAAAGDAISLREMFSSALAWLDPRNTHFS